MSQPKKKKTKSDSTTPCNAPHAILQGAGDNATGVRDLHRRTMGPTGVIGDRCVHQLGRFSLICTATQQPALTEVAAEQEMAAEQASKGGSLPVHRKSVQSFATQVHPCPTHF